MITFTTPSGDPIPYHPYVTVTGYLPSFLSEDDPRPAREQIDANYGHGGGWRPFLMGMTLKGNALHFPGDPPYPLVAKAKLRDETLLLFKFSWLAIVQPDGSYEIAMVD